LLGVIAAVALKSICEPAESASRAMEGRRDGDSQGPDDDRDQ
jgi:hypothetical protein